MKNKITGMLFGLLFFLPGVALLYVLLGEPVALSWSAQSWRPVPATLESVKLKSSRSDNSTTWQAMVRYRYQVDGRWYESDRLNVHTGSDNIGSYHQDMVRLLKRKQQNGGAVRAYVNPDDPAEALLDRSIRWGLLALSGVLGGAFTLIGGTVLVLSARKSSSAAVGKQKDWGDVRPVFSNEKNGRWLWLFMGVAFFGLSAPAVLAIPEEVGKENYLILLVLLFPLVGCWLFWLTFKAFREWQHFGPLPVTLNPWPGQVGGDVGGEIELREPWSAANRFEFVLNCVKVRITGSGKNRSRHETIVWSNTMPANTEASGVGTRLAFRFAVPGHLPVSEESSRSYHLWRLVLRGESDQGKMPELNRSYEIPLENGQMQSTLAVQARHEGERSAQENTELLQQASEQIQIEPTPGGYRIKSASGRNLKMVMVLFVCGVMFATGSVFLFMKVPSEGFMLAVMGTAFGLFGFPMLFAAPWIAGRSLTTEIRGAEVVSTRYFLGFALFSRRIHLYSVSQLSLQSGGSSTSSNGEKVEYLHLVAQGSGTGDDGKKIRLAEGIEGKRVAQAMRDALVRFLRLPD